MGSEGEAKEEEGRKGLERVEECGGAKGRSGRGEPGVT